MEWHEDGVEGLIVSSFFEDRSLRKAGTRFVAVGCHDDEKVLHLELAAKLRERASSYAGSQVGFGNAEAP